MRNLIVFRHGKSDWSAPAGGDHERPLEQRGVRAARRMGRFLAENGPAPDLVLASSALRARTTAELAHAAGGWDCPLEVAPELYETGAAAVLALLAERGGDAGTVVVAGHEPTSSELVALLTAGPPPTFPTAAMACLELDPSGPLEPGTARLVWLVTPRELGADED